MFFWRAEKKPHIAIGLVYERNLKDNIMERAEITWLGDDRVGIPHVRFDVIIPGIDECRDARLLAVKIFAARYAQSSATALAI